ncbi:uncharacterized protein [Cicer arietinum]|uniref:Uncharacterized protein LOC101491926 n=1 Tax=Cicer arietinum TaxID=3827 RepID=A0A1S2YSU0_CICAR|nr:uncharacterized protein LOC101491926 [Cicer arietinum]
METTSLSSNSPSLINIILTRRSFSLPSIRHNHFLPPQPHSSLTFHSIITCSSSSSNTDTNNDETDSVQAPTDEQPVELRIRRRSRRQARRQRENGAVSNGMQQASKVKAAPKKWEEMSLTEKAIELYVGEKGALFWLNKFAYASIFIMIGAWILFRFVGPALDIYQLDSPLLSPGDVLKGSS